MRDVFFIYKCPFGRQERETKLLLEPSPPSSPSSLSLSKFSFLLSSASNCLLSPLSPSLFLFPILLYLIIFHPLDVTLSLPFFFFSPESNSYLTPLSLTIPHPLDICLSFSPLPIFSFPRSHSHLFHLSLTISLVLAYLPFFLLS